MKIFINTFNRFNTAKTDNQYQTKTSNINYGVSGSLKPLKQDTVTFGGRKTLLAEDMSIAPSLKTCSSVNKNAEPARYYLERILGEYVGPFVDETDTLSRKQYPVLKCKVRIKSPISIKEKVVSKYSAAYTKMSEDFVGKVYSELTKCYKPNEDCDVNKLIKIIAKRINAHNDNGVFLPYLNPGFYYQVVLSLFELENVFDFPEVDDDKQLETDKTIIENLQQYVEEAEILPPTETHDGVKKYANDIVGARIVLREGDSKYSKKVFNAIKQAVEDGKLKITSIENNIPDPDKLPAGDDISNYMYASDSILNSLARSSGAKLKTNKSKTGYTAVHINVDFSDCDFASKDSRFSGYQGEIQIIGAEVEKLKEIEDLCYKLKDNKNAIKAEYKPFKKHFKNIIPERKSNRLLMIIHTDFILSSVQ